MTQFISPGSREQGTSLLSCKIFYNHKRYYFCSKHVTMQKKTQSIGPTSI